MLDQTTVVDATAKIIARQEQELITRAKSGDRAAFQQIYLQYHKRVFGICFRMLADKEVAEDVTQEVFIQLWQKLDNFRGESKFSTWVMKIAIRIVYSEMRKAGWKDVSIDAASETTKYDTKKLVSDVASPEKQTMQVVIIDRLWEAIDDSLTDKQKKAVIADFVVGMPIEEIARQMKTNRNAVVF